MVVYALFLIVYLRESILCAYVRTAMYTLVGEGRAGMLVCWVDVYICFASWYCHCDDVVC